MSTHIRLHGKLLRVDAPDASRTEWRITAEDGKVWLQPVDITEIAPGVLSLIFDGSVHRASLDSIAGEPCVVLDGTRVPFTMEDPRSLAARRAGTAGSQGPKNLVSPMPGRVVRILAEQGTAVTARQGVLVVEAMKMQNEIKAPKDGVVSAILVKPGDTVTAGQPLATIA